MKYYTDFFYIVNDAAVAAIAVGYAIVATVGIAIVIAVIVICYKKIKVKLARKFDQKLKYGSPGVKLNLCHVFYLHHYC